MEVTRGTSAGGALAALTGDWMLIHNAATNRFERRFALSLPTAGISTALRWQSNTVCTLSFPTFDYDAHAPGAPEAVQLTNNGSDGVQLTFPFARTLLRLKVNNAQSTDVIEARRVDGNVVTEDAFGRANHGSTGALLNATDVRLLLRQKRADVAIPLRAATVAQVLVRSSAANVRIGVLLPALGNEVFSLGPDAGAVLTTPTSATNVGAALAALLQMVSDRLTDSLGGETLPASLALTLIIESDTPTRAHISAFALRYRLYRAQFANSATKQTFDFPGKTLVNHSFNIDVPHSATLWSARLRMMGPFSVPTNVDANDADNASDGVQSPTTSDLGVALRLGESVANRLSLSSAALVQGAVLEVTALAPGSVGIVQLHANDHDQPGTVLATATSLPVSAGVQRVLRVDFNAPVTLGAGPVWISLQCANGELLWLTPTPDTTTSAALVRRRDATATPWAVVTAATARGTVASLVTVANSGDDANASNAFHGVQLRLAARPLAGAHPSTDAAGAKETHFAIANELTQHLNTTSARPLAPVTLTLAASESGRVTVYPAEFEFDV